MGRGVGVSFPFLLWAALRAGAASLHSPTPSAHWTPVTLLSSLNSSSSGVVEDPALAFLRVPPHPLLVLMTLPIPLYVFPSPNHLRGIVFLPGLLLVQKYQEKTSILDEGRLSSRPCSASDHPGDFEQTTSPLRATATYLISRRRLDLCQEAHITL